MEEDRPFEVLNTTLEVLSRNSSGGYTFGPERVYLSGRRGKSGEGRVMRNKYGDNVGNSVVKY